MRLQSSPKEFPCFVGQIGARKVGGPGPAVPGFVNLARFLPALNLRFLNCAAARASCYDGSRLLAPADHMG